MFTIETRLHYTIDGISIEQQFDGKANHRLSILVGDKAYLSDPESYGFISVVDTPAGTFAGTSDFYLCHLPRVFRVVAADHV